MASLTSRSNTSHGSYDNSIAAAAAITTNNTANPILNTAGTTSRRLRSEAPWWWGSSRSHGTPLRVVASTMSMVKITMATGILLVSSVMVYQFAWTHWLPGWLAPADTELDWDRGRTVTRRRPDKMVKTLRSGETVPRTPLDGILEGHLTLIDIEIAPTSLFQSIPDGTATPEGPFYNGVMATFCHISWDLQDDDPSSFPVFADLQQASFLCPGTRVTVDLWDVARQAEHYDTAMVQRVGERTVSVPPTAVIFHESKCGSTVVSNALAAYRLHHTRVYSEATAPLKALLVCRHNTNNTTNNNNIDENKGGINSETEISCDPDSRTKLIQDVFFMMGRVTRPQLPQYVFYKMPSRAVLALSTFVQAMPMTPWVFVYRDPIEVMMSQFQKDYQATSIAASGSSKANNDLDCLRTFGQPVEGQPMGLIELVAASSSTGDGGSKEWTDLTREEYCAAYIALLCQSAVQEHQRTKDFVMTGASYLHSISASVEGADGTALLASSAVAASHTVAAPRLFINYNELPFKVWETLIPLVVLLVKGSISHDEIELMQAATRVYSHGGRTGKKRPKKKDQQQQEKNIWKDDITLKQGQAPTSIKDAAHLFLDPVYAQLESIRTSMEHQSHP